jgi:hypothetical protein
MDGNEEGICANGNAKYLLNAQSAHLPCVTNHLSPFHNTMMIDEYYCGTECITANSLFL